MFKIEWETQWYYWLRTRYRISRPTEPYYFITDFCRTPNYLQNISSFRLKEI